ncbi:protein kinase [Planomonospora sp. ID67723]|uniref:serine/threonine-protein kinase n=1 Tax=Planomonospora sp. ID67723 TaxID=2738134 RepID=UPI0018C3A33A|nr:serine/threonine-protein kinase [Planomonospora sp. ID67723]MBG0829808.1 protein kinase [Planomonospora sp. ID67723]
MVATPLTPDDPVRLGEFRLAGRLGEGGQGIVYLAHAPSGEPVAVKLLFRADAESRRRLARELAALESVAPFCTARVLTASVDGPRPYVVSEFVNGPSLEQRVKERGPLRGGELERLVVGTATALAAIHAAGVVHRDFKPANVLLGPDGPRVVDFGIAREDGAATHTSGLIGTPAYLSPEQIAGSPASPASDVFAWAATMVCAAAGRSPFGADTVPAVLHRILSHHPDLSALPARYGALIASCLDKDPARRPTARALMINLVAPGVHTPHSTEDLVRIGSELASSPPDGREQTAPGRSALTTRAGRGRPRGFMIGSILVVASVLVAAGIAAWLAFGRPAGGLGATSTPTAATGSSPAGSTASSPDGTTSPDPDGTTGSPPAGNGVKIPPSFAGSWSGDGVSSTNPLAGGPKRIEVELEAGGSDAAWAEPGNNCTGRITLQKVEKDTLVFALGANTGGCIAGTVWLTRKGDLLTYTWKDVPGLGLVTETGDLSRSP